MNVVIIAIGSFGDVLPLCGLAERLRADGHQVAVATQTIFADAVRATGCEFRPLPGDLRATMAGPDGRTWIREGNRPAGLRAQVRILTELMDALSEGVPKVVPGADVLVLQNTATVHGYEMARALGVPGMTVAAFPVVPTREFTLGAKSFGQLNRIAGRVRRLLEPVDTWSGVSASLREFQKDIGVVPTSLNEVRERFVTDPDWDIHHAFSEHLIPRPDDWRPGVDVVGYLWPPVPRDWAPPAELVDFLEAGPPPVFIGFGSNSVAAPALPEVIRSAVRRAKVRAVVQSGWAELTVTDDEIITIGDAPHEWLFPRMRAVVYHGGAGTTGAVLRAGVPAVPVPVVPDSYLNAARLRHVGVSPGWVSWPRMSARRLATLIRAVTADESCARRAQEMGRLVGTQDGIGRLADLVTAKGDTRRRR